MSKPFHSCYVIIDMFRSRMRRLRRVSGKVTEDDETFRSGARDGLFQASVECLRYRRGSDADPGSG